MSKTVNPPDGWTFAGVHRGPDGLMVVLCCEPAEGRTALVDSPGAVTIDESFGTVGGVDAKGRWLRILANGHAVELVATDGTLLATSPSTSDGFPGESSISPDGRSAAVLLEIDKREIVLFDPSAGAPLESGTVVFESTDPTAFPRLPAIDHDGRVWFAVDDAEGGTTGYVFDPSTGSVVETFDYPRRPADQQFDLSGYFLIVTYDDGSVGWMAAPGESIPLADEGYVVADW